MSIEKSNVVIHIVWGIIYFRQTQLFKIIFLNFPRQLISFFFKITIKAKLSLLFLPRRTVEIAPCVFCFYIAS